MKYLIYALLLTYNFAFAQNKPIGENILNTNRIGYLSAKKDAGEISKIELENNDFQFLFETKEEPKFIYNLSTNIPLIASNYKKGSVFLLSYKAKTEKASLETGEAKMLWILKQTEDYKGNIESTQSISSDWQTYYIPFEANQYIKKDDLGLVMQFGYREQAFLIKDIKFEAFPENTNIKDLPKTKITYQGMEPDALWRKDAIKRIETIRKGNFIIQVTQNGVAIPNKDLNIKLIKHHFPFGAAVNAEDVVEDNFKYKNFKKAFSLAVFENDLKIKSWSREKNRERTLEAMDILKKDNIQTKGHVLIWPGFRYLTPEVKANKDNPEKVTQLVKAHVADILNATKGKVSHWDVVNECYTNKDLQEITNSEDILYEGFRLAKEMQPSTYRFINEYGIISKGGLDTKKQQWYYDFIKRIDANTGGLVQGIGIQSHIGSDLTSPERVLEILAFYATLGKQISISEFTMDIQDPEIREQYTRDFLIAAFSHPSVVEFLFWGYTENEKMKVDIFKHNGELGVMGKAYFDLVHGEWKTNLNGKTDTEGFAKGAGFYGDYEYSLVHNGELVKGQFNLKPRQRGIIKIELNK
jgi:endo-1,4-beta-xylanase